MALSISGESLVKRERIARKIRIFLTVFPLFMPKSKSLPSLFAHSLLFKERLERFAPVPLYKRATVSNSLRSKWQKSYVSDSLFFTGESHFNSKNDRIARKTDERIPNFVHIRLHLNEFNPKNRQFWLSARIFYFPKIVETLKINTLFFLNCKYLLLN